MKILSCCPLGYYSSGAGKCYEYESFVEVPRQMGHRVHHLEIRLMSRTGREAMNEFFVDVARRGGYDLVLVMTQEDELLPEALDEAKRHAIVTAWNTDDDWRWESYSSKWVSHYTFMVTTYRHIYEANRPRHPNLLLSQWGCTGFREGLEVRKDIDFGFVGQAYGTRAEQLDLLRRRMGLAAWGRKVRPLRTWKGRVRKEIARLFGVPTQEKRLELETQEEVKDIWNRSKVSWTPLYAYRGDGSQIKARVFDMGLSGTVMLCSKNPALYEFYAPGKEFVEYDSMEECIDKARFLLSRDSEREAIARRYCERTRAQHLWRHRYENLFSAMGLR